MEKHIYLVRHGESEGNAGRIFHGREALLTEKGHEQAERVAERIARIGVSAIITSPFPRAVSTAQAISEVTGSPIEQSDFFVEWTPPSSFLGQSHDNSDLKKIDEKILNSSDVDYRYSDEETFSELLVRVEKAVEFIDAYSSEHLCVVTHGGFIRLLVGFLMFHESFTKEHFKRMLNNFSLYNTGITHLKYDFEQRGWHLITWNDQSHLG